MSLVLTLENGPRSQKKQDARLDQGELVIGRSPEADWQIEDPDMFVSRAHCRITGQPGAYFVTDTSSSGLFIDDASHPLGAGNTAELRSGMRLRLGDYVLWVDTESPQRTVAPAPANTSRQAGLPGDDFFSARPPAEPKPVRPANLPNPFDQPEPGAYSAASENERPRSAAFDDPFSLDPVSGDPVAGEKPAAGAGAADPFGFAQAPGEPAASGAGWFDDFGATPQSLPDLAPARPAEPASEPRGFASGFEDLAQPAAPPARPPWLDVPDDEPAVPPPAPMPVAPPPAMRSPKPAAPVPPRRQPPRPQPAPAAAPAGGDALRDAFFNGLGLDPAEFPTADAAAEMERLGREYRLMLEGLMQLLRKRAEEKGNARLAQTTVFGAEVNPLKFLPGGEEALFAIMSERSPGFLRGEAAVSEALRDLAEHHIRIWRGIQKALRKMIDRFDPAAIEKELESSSTVGQLLSGGRSAMLWKLYAKRHREIAANAESRFMGEVGADFRDAYEED
jgi:type VI secretion system protein ImpI